jgi:hypothetical protein
MLRAIDLSPLAVAKRLGSHGENALADVNRKTLRMRVAKLSFRLKHLLKGGLIPPCKLRFELFSDKSSFKTQLVSFPRLGL